MTGSAADAPALAERALRIAESVEDLPLSVAANYQLGTSYFVVGDYRRTDEFFQRILQLLAGDRLRGHRGSEAWARRLLGEIASCPDRPDMATTETHNGAA